MTLKSKSAWSLLLLQSFFIVIFAFFVKYGPEADAADPSHTKFIGSRRSGDNNFNKSYPMFQDINVLVFIGIGFLYAFLGKYSYTGIGMNFLLCAISIQWGIITQKCWTMNKGKMDINIHTLIKSEFAAASGVISLGAIFGKVGLLQMIIFIMIEELLYSVLNHCRLQYLQVCDFGESVTLHMFAAIFGCSAAYVVDKKRKVQGNANERSSYNSNIFCMLGAILVWCYWPSFNAAEDEGDSQHRTVVNTFFALIGSGISCFAMSSLLSEDSKFTMSHIQNGVIAGAVGVGSTANLMIQPFGALTIGTLAGCICVAGFKFFATFLARLHIYDPCGINSLHGLPGFFAGITGIFATLIANEETYGNSLYKIYPAMAPTPNVTAFGDFQEGALIKTTYGRTILSQALFQLFYIVLTMVTSCFSGLITGLILRMKILDPIEEKYMYIDEMMWKLPDIEINESKQDTETKKNYCTFQN